MRERKERKTVSGNQCKSDKFRWKHRTNREDVKDMRENNKQKVKNSDHRVEGIKISMNNEVQNLKERMSVIEINIIKWEQDSIHRRNEWKKRRE